MEAAGVPIKNLGTLRWGRKRFLVNMVHLPGKLDIRRAKSDEFEAVRDLVQTLVDQTYAGIWSDPPLAIGNEDWSTAWVALSGETIVGMALTQNEWVEDLWIYKDYRRAGIGRRLLARAELEIAERGYSVARLRVVSSNRDAIRFYERCGWSSQGVIPHEIYPIEMTEMGKYANP
jgi:ribosomal protein S18 acetylase RimI-like enzyme